MSRASSLLILLPTLIYGIAPWFADWNETHLFHPAWTAHSKFHMMWLLCVNSAIAGAALYLFARGRRIEATLAGLLVFTGFWVATVTRALYGGSLSDLDGGYQGLAGVDLNALVFGVCTVLLVAGFMFELKQLKSATAHPSG